MLNSVWLKNNTFNKVNVLVPKIALWLAFSLGLWIYAVVKEDNKKISAEKKQ